MSAGFAPWWLALWHVLSPENLKKSIRSFILTQTPVSIAGLASECPYGAIFTLHDVPEAASGQGYEVLSAPVGLPAMSTL